VNLGENVFKGVAPSCIFVTQKATPKGTNVVLLQDLSRYSPAEKDVKLGQANEETIGIEQQVFSKNTELEFMKNVGKISENVRRLGDVQEFKCKDSGINYQRVNVGMRVKGNSDLAERLMYEGKRERAVDHMFWKGFRYRPLLGSPKHGSLLQTGCEATPK
jgi:hypothetical protein